MTEVTGPLKGLKVIDAATLFAGPLIGTMLGDAGADVLKIEHPKGDPARTHGHLKNGIGLWWKVIARNKRCITLNFSKPQGAQLLKRLAADADVLIENFRPGTLERWGVGWDVLHALNPRLVLARVTGFGQEGPYASRPGFGTLAESMSGFAHITGQPDGPPTLPPLALADSITALTGAWAVVSALYHRDLRGGQGQMIDLAIYEPMLTVVGAQPTVYDQLGIIPGRVGNRSTNTAPRNTYKTREGRWVAISTSSDNIAERVMRLVGHPEVISEPWFASGRGRAQHNDELDQMVADWIAQRDLDEVLRAFTAAEAAIAPIYDVSQIMADPHIRPRSIIELPDPDLGQVKMQDVIARFSATPAQVRWAGEGLGAHNRDVYCGRLGLTADQMQAMQAAGVI